jgi:hypothetical protein
MPSGVSAKPTRKKESQRRGVPAAFAAFIPTLQATPVLQTELNIADGGNYAFSTGAQFQIKGAQD